MADGNTNKPAFALSDAPIDWTPELEAARIELCEFWVDIASYAKPIILEDLLKRARDTEAALTILGDIVNQRVAGASRGEFEFVPTQPLTFTYRNWKGEASVRRVTPQQIRFGSTEWHPTPQYLLRAFDLDKQAVRDFAFADISPAPPGELADLVLEMADAVDLQAEDIGGERRGPLDILREAVQVAEAQKKLPASQPDHPENMRKPFSEKGQHVSNDPEHIGYAGPGGAVPIKWRAHNHHVWRADVGDYRLEIVLSLGDGTWSWKVDNTGRCRLASYDDARAGAEADLRIRIERDRKIGARAAAAAAVLSVGKAHPIASRYHGIEPGLYVIHWKSGGTSTAAFGILVDGNRWMAPTNWVAPSTNPASAIWDDIDHVVPVEPSEPLVGWIVGNGAGNRWRCWRDGWSDWTDDRAKATRYARREDAEEVHREDEGAWTIEPYKAGAAR